MDNEYHILFVCLGNIVRSPLAENLFRDLAEKRGVGKKYRVDSGGTGAWHIGERPDPRMRKVAASHGLNYSGRARKVEKHDFDRFDLIIAMDHENKDDLRRRAPTPDAERKIRLLREFDPQGSPNMPVPDPYYGGIEGFENVYQIILRSCENLLDTLERGMIS